MIFDHYRYKSAESYILFLFMYASGSTVFPVYFGIKFVEFIRIVFDFGIFFEFGFLNAVVIVVIDFVFICVISVESGCKRNV